MLKVTFHGADAKYRGGYKDAVLKPYAKWLAARAKSGADVYVYFNNDIGGHAPRDAVRLRDMIASRL